MSAFRHACTLALVASACALVPKAHAARAYDSCTGYIDSLPAVVMTQGTWCLRHDLATNVSSGAAITVAANNVTIDCNDFKLGGLGGGPDSTAVGITSNGFANSLIRHCSVRGFRTGIKLLGARGAVVEDNRLDGQTYAGVDVAGSASIVRGNTIANTAGPASAFGIRVEGTADVLANLVGGVEGPTAAFGIYSAGNVQGSISDNTVRGITGASPWGIRLTTGTQVSSQVSITGNVLMSLVASSNAGIDCTGSAASRARGNRIVNFTLPLAGCRDDGNAL